MYVFKIKSYFKTPFTKQSPNIALQEALNARKLDHFLSLQVFVVLEIFSYNKILKTSSII
jgi:hypothetical protein